MKHQEVKNLQQELITLLNECVEKKITSFHLNWGLDKNLTKINKAVESINKNIDKELIELDQAALKLGKDANAKLEASEVITDENTLFNSGLLLLTKEQQEKRLELSKVYVESMQEEDDLKLFLLDPTKLENINIEYPYYLILKKFFPSDGE